MPSIEGETSRSRPACCIPNFFIGRLQFAKRRPPRHGQCSNPRHVPAATGCPVQHPIQDDLFAIYDPVLVPTRPGSKPAAVDRAASPAITSSASRKAWFTKPFLIWFELGTGFCCYVDHFSYGDPTVTHRRGPLVGYAPQHLASRIFGPHGPSCRRDLHQLHRSQLANP